MSYIPHILVNHDQLVEQRKELIHQDCYFSSSYHKDDFDVMYPINTLTSLLEDSPIDINGTNIVRIESQDTSNQHRLIKEKLDELEVQYWLID